MLNVGTGSSHRYPTRVSRLDSIALTNHSNVNKSSAQPFFLFLLAEHSC